MRKGILYVLIAGLVAGAVWLFQENSGIVQQYVENGEFITLKAKYTSEQIMEAHKKELLVDNQHSFHDGGLKYHPYLLMEIKYYLPDKKSREGVALWSLVDGEMVINTDTWEKSHGYRDAINADASRNDFKIMLALAKAKGASSFEKLQKDLGVEKETLKQWIDSALDKHLIVKKGSTIQLHFQDPKISFEPETKMKDALVKKPYNHGQRVSSKYTNSQIQKIGKAAFGEDFTVRSLMEVFLPVYTIEVVNPDGSIFPTHWNALTGQRMSPPLGAPGW